MRKRNLLFYRSSQYPVISLLLLLAAAGAATNEDVLFYTESGHAEFTSSVPLHSFTGESDHLTGMIDFRENLVDFYLDLNTLKTGIGKRDRDMYETLNAEEHPYAEFTGSLITSFAADSSGEQLARVSGEFTINGQTREVTIEGSLQSQNEALILRAGWELRLEDYDIEAPGILFYRVDEVQSIRIEATLRPRDRESLETK